MAKHYIIWEDGVEDNIEVFNSEPVIVVHAAREDLDKLSSLDEANLPGVYVLYAGNTRYVGQASKSVYNRISQHDKRKPWWTNLVIIAREDGRLDKSQLDFMENRLIKDSMRADLTMDNGTEGNSSHIETYQKGKAQQVLVTGLRILEENAGVVLFKKIRIPTGNAQIYGALESSALIPVDNTEIRTLDILMPEKEKERSQHKYTVSSNKWNESSETLRSALVKLFQYLVINNILTEEQLVAFCIRSKSAYIVKSEDVVDGNRYIAIPSTNISITNSLSYNRALFFLSRLRSIGIDAKLKKVDFSSQFTSSPTAITPAKSNSSHEIIIQHREKVYRGITIRECYTSFLRDTLEDNPSLASVLIEHSKSNKNSFFASEINDRKDSHCYSIVGNGIVARTQISFEKAQRRISLISNYLNESISISKP